ncbi:MAG: riboflavin biosynthesis protein RibF [Tannerellaceae bacterium]|jgi:riboflavin kinase/FMN adenylyltransferase|nr:riboflavin biosynthesis protein RibF [Tannerellaceae bacterium]
MQLVRRIDEIKETGGLLATIGFFDGVHLGHRFLIREMKEAARERGLPTAVITFPRHPRLMLHADYQPKLLNSFEEKITHLAETGIDYCIVLDFTTGLSQLTAEAFITSVLSRQWRVKTLFVGYDHRFGRDRTDDFRQYASYGAGCGMEVLQAPCFVEDERKVSSSEIRKQLVLGKVEQAAALLTYPYQLKGHIVRGNRIGWTLGFPTANIRIDEAFKVLPCEGVYAVWVDLRGERYKGMLYIGRRPTFDSGPVVPEVHILDFQGDIYTNEITVSFMYYVRADIRFHSPEELKEQLEQDKKQITAYFENHVFLRSD